MIATQECVDCEPGTVQPASGPGMPTVCIPCSSGEYQPASGQPECLTCPCPTCPAGAVHTTTDGTGCKGEFTVNSEIFARVLFTRNFANAKLSANKTITKWQNHFVVN